MSSTTATGIVTTLSVWRSGSPVQLGTDGTRKSPVATSTSPSCSSSEKRSSGRPCPLWPPKISATPSTSRMFETTLPASEPRTTFGSDALTAKSAMISSGALPKLAFRNPPIPGPVCSPACSVASPISHASGTSAIAEAMKSVVSPASSTKRRKSVIGASTSDAQRSFRPTPSSLASVLEAVLFDWGDTLMECVYSPELVAAGHRAGLAAIGQDERPELTEHFREEYEPLFCAPGTIEEIEYPQLVRRLLGDFDLEVDEEALGRFLEAEHRAWDPARVLGAHTHPLLEALRGLGLKLGLVSNAFD